MSCTILSEGERKGKREVYEDSRMLEADGMKENDGVSTRKFLDSLRRALFRGETGWPHSTRPHSSEYPNIV